MLHCSLPWKQCVPGTSFSTLGWRALESNGRRTTPALWKSLCTTIAGGVRSSVLQQWLEGPAGWPGTSFCCMNRKAWDQPLPNGKSSIKESGTTKERKKEKKKLSLAFRFARHTCRTATGNARGNLRVMQGQEMRRGRDTWKKATRQFFWGQQMDWDFISISGFKPPQFERMMALGHICMWSASYTTQGAQMPWGWELSKYLIGKISSMYIRQRKLLWNKYFPQSVKTRASEDLNSSIGTDGLTNTFSLSLKPQRLSLFED